MPKGTEVASFSEYQKAAQAVELLGEKDFPLGQVTIAGTDVVMVENVVAKLTPGRVAFTGASQGLTWGLLMGLFAIIFIPDAPVIVPLGALAVGVLVGVVMASLSWGLNKNRRTFASQTGLVASRYAVLVEGDSARAHQLLAHMPGNLGAGAKHEAPGARNARVSEARNETVTKRAATRPATNSFEDEGKPRYGVRVSSPRQDADTGETPDTLKTPDPADDSAAPQGETQDS